MFFTLFVVEMRERRNGFDLLCIAFPTSSLNTLVVTWTFVCLLYCVLSSCVIILHTLPFRRLFIIFIIMKDDDDE